MAGSWDGLQHNGDDPPENVIGTDGGDGGAGTDTLMTQFDVLGRSVDLLVSFVLVATAVS